MYRKYHLINMYPIVLLRQSINQWFIQNSNRLLGACVHLQQTMCKKQCVRLDEEIKTCNNNISCYSSVNNFKLSKINTANLKIILQRSHVISSINLDIDGFRQY